MQSHGITLSFYGEMADASGELVGPDGSAMPPSACRASIQRRWAALGSAWHWANL